MYSGIGAERSGDGTKQAEHAAMVHIKGTHWIIYTHPFRIGNFNALRVIQI